MKLQIGAGGTRSCGPSRRHESSSGLASLEPQPEPPAAVRLRGRVAPPGRKPGGPGRREGLDIFVEYSFQDKGRGEIPHGQEAGGLCSVLRDGLYRIVVCTSGLPRWAPRWAQRFFIACRRLRPSPLEDGAASPWSGCCDQGDIGKNLSESKHQQT